MTLKRSYLNLWQVISGGGEGGESFIEAAKREAFEESELPGAIIKDMGKI